jgi:hypothetical protein
MTSSPLPDAPAAPCPDLTRWRCVMLLALLLAHSPGAGAEETVAGVDKRPVEPTAECRPAHSELEVLTAEAERLASANAILADLLAGKRVPEPPLRMLFSIDVSSQEQVELQRRELDVSLEQEKASSTLRLTPEALQSCPPLRSALEAKAEAVGAARAENSRLKLDFLRQPDDVRRNLVSQQGILDDLRASQRQLASEVETQKKARDQAKLDEQKAAQRAEESTDRGEKDLAAAAAQLEAARGDIAAFHARWLENLRDLVEHQRAAAEQLVVLSGRSLAADTVTRRIALYSEVLPLWRRLTDEGLLIFDMALNVDGLPTLPARPSDLLARLAGTPQASQYEASYAEAERSREKFVADFTAESRALADKQYHIQDQAAILRAKLYQQLCGETAFSRALSIDEVVHDVVREIRAIPYRASGRLYAKYLGYKAGLNGTLQGALVIGRDAAALLLVPLIPLAALLLLRRTIVVLDRLRVKLATGPDSRRELALLLHRVTPYLPWATCLLALWLTKSLVTVTDLSELAALFDLARYFVYYRVFRLLVRDVFDALRLRLEMARDAKSSALIDGTATLVGRFFLVAAMILHVTELAVGRALVYGYVVELARVLGLLVLAIAAQRWSFVIEPLARSVLPTSQGAWVARQCSGARAYIACLPALLGLFVSMAATRLLRLISDLDTAKRISAKLYRRRVESRAAEAEGARQRANAQLPEDYLRLFLDDGLDDLTQWCSGNDQELGAIKRQIDEWLCGVSAEQSTAIYGEKGVGKTTVLQRLARDYAGKVQVVNLEIPPKILTRESCRSLLAGALGLAHDADLAAALVAPERESNAARTLVLVDDAHNLFLGTVGAFEAYLELMDIVNSETSSIFWCLTFNEHAWTFLRGYFTSNQHIRAANRLLPWSDAEISELILGKHRQSGLRLRFDQAILAAQSSSLDRGGTYAEQQFFRLLWEQAKGNPRVAMSHWLTALSPLRPGCLRVSLPPELNAKVLDRLSDDACFVYAAIARHESLTSRELVRVLDVPLAAVSLALKAGIETGLVLRCAERRHWLNPDWHNHVIAHLKRKNFLYGFD